MEVGEILLSGMNVLSPVEEQNTPELGCAIILHQSMAELSVTAVMHPKLSHVMIILVQVCPNLSKNIILLFYLMFYSRIYPMISSNKDFN
jgi:hypothetical protein